MTKLAILYICTGEYVSLWREFYESFEKFFLTSCRKDYYVFTDAEHIDHEDDERIHIINKEPLKWPYATLFRFHMFNDISEELRAYDYIFFVNANGMAVSNIEDSMILPRAEKNEDIVVVKHPAYRNKKPYQFPYDRNFKCKACIPYGRGKVYVQGCLIGGTATAFLSMSKIIANMIDVDLEKNIIALWHDESYLNKYILKYKAYRLLGSEFAMPILNYSMGAYLYMRPKEIYFNVDAIKDNSEVANLSKFNKLVNDYYYNFREKFDIMRSDVKIISKSQGKIYVLFWTIKTFVKILINR